MPKIIDIPYGTYLGQVIDISDVKINDKEYVQLKTEIVYGEWHDYFNAATNAKGLSFYSGSFNLPVGNVSADTSRIRDYITNYKNKEKILVAVEIDKVRFGKENQYHNITNLYDWRTCDTLSTEAKAWAEKHWNDDVYDNTPTVYDMLPYALQYAQAGLRVFPLTPCDKMPLQGSRGLYEATNNLNKIRQWWTTNPFYNIGCATGGDIVVIDIDEGTDNNGGNKSGEDSITQWQSENGQLPDTLTAISGKGGRHLYYRTTHKCSSKTGVIKNVDIRADGGYIVLPPSIHPNGNRYTWVDDFSIDKIVPANDVVYKLIDTNHKSPNASAGNDNIIPQGIRNDTLYRKGCSMQGRGLDDNVIYSRLADINNKQCKPPIEDNELIKIYNSVVQLPKGRKNTSALPKCNTEMVYDNVEDQIRSIEAEYPYVDVHYRKNAEGKGGIFSYNISAPRLAQYISSTEHYFFLQSPGDTPISYWYVNGVYRQINEREFCGRIKEYIAAIDEEKVEPALINKVYRLILTDLDNSVEPNQLNADSNIINFANGLLHLDTLSLHPHTPDIYSTIQIPCDWNPQALSSPAFNSFLHTISSGDKSVKQLLWEYIGYAVSNIPGYKCKQALILYGAGNTGKSQYLSLLEKLVGSENYCSMSLQQLEMRFGTSALWGKRLAGNADMGSAKIDELEKFKAITGGDTIDYEFKGKDRFSAKYTGLLIFCCNNLPKFGGDRGEHVYDRMITLPCNNVVPFDQRDRNLIEKIYAEREAIIYHSVIALKKLIERGGYFDVPEVCQKAREEYKTSNDNVRQFLIDCTNCNGSKVSGKGINEYTRTSAMYDYYKRWCADSCYTATNRREFRRGIENYFGRKIDTIEFIHNGNMYYLFSLKSEIRQRYYPYGV